MLTALLNFVLGGGLLALVQAGLSAWASWQLKQAGATENADQSAQKELQNVGVAKSIDAAVDLAAPSSIPSQLRQFERD